MARPAAQSLDFCLLPVHLKQQRGGPLLPSSLVQVQGVQVARQEERHCQQSPGLKKSADQMMLHSWLSQQFFPAASPRSWRKSLVRWCQHTPLSNARFSCEPGTLRLGCTNTANSTCCCMGALINLTILSGILNLVGSNQRDEWLSESKAALRST